MLRPDLQTATIAELTEYALYAEKILCGASKLQIQMALLCDVLAEEIQKVNAGEVSIGGLPILMGEEKLFERLLAVVKNKSEFIALALITSTEETTTKTTKQKVNIQDYVVKSK